MRWQLLLAPNKSSPMRKLKELAQFTKNKSWKTNAVFSFASLQLYDFCIKLKGKHSRLHIAKKTAWIAYYVITWSTHSHLVCQNKGPINHHQYTFTIVTTYCTLPIEKYRARVKLNFLSKPFLSFYQMYRLMSKTKYYVASQQYSKEATSSLTLHLDETLMCACGLRVIYMRVCVCISPRSEPLGVFRLALTFP